MDFAANGPRGGEMVQAAESSSTKPARFQALTALAESEFRWFMAGNMAFFMAMQMQFVLRGYLAFELTRSAGSLGLIALAMGMPMLIAAPFGGAIADRMNKRTLLIITQSGAAIASVMIAVLIIGGWIEFWHLLVVSLVTGMIFSFNMPARQALVPQLVPRHKLMNAISLQMGGMTFTQIASPAVAGLLIGPFGAGWVYAMTAVLFCMATYTEFHLPKHGMTAQANAGPMLTDMRAGFTYVFGHPLIRVLMLTGFLMPLLGFPVQQLLPVFAREVYGRGPEVLGMLAAMTGVGGLVGAAISANMDKKPRKGLLLLGGAALTGVSLLGFALAPNLAVAMIGLALAGVGQMLFQATHSAVIQTTVAPEIRARVMSLMMMTFGLMPLGVLPITAAADTYGAPNAVAVAACLFLATMALVFIFVPGLLRLRIDALSRAELSPVRAAEMVAQGKITQAEADRMTGVGGGRPAAEAAGQAEAVETRG